MNMTSRLAYSSRCALLRITGRALAELMSPADPAAWMRVVAPTVPPDARYLAVIADPMCDTVCLMFEHPSFPATPPGCHFPFLDPPGWETRPVEGVAAPHVETAD